MGAIDYILKPFNPIVLKAKVDAFVELYKMNKKLTLQAGILTKKTEELENSYRALSKITSELRVSEAMANVISETSIDSMIIIDIDGTILRVNPAVKEMFAYNEQAILGQNILLLFSSDSSQKYIKGVLDTINNLDFIAGNGNLKELTATRKDGNVFPAEIQIGKRFVQDQCIVACTIRDITKNKQNQEIITHMAYHDGLTDLPNRRKFNDELIAQLYQAKGMNQTLAIMYLDMDHFKYINDSLGHLFGDQVLKEIAVRLKESLREGDFVSRVGGG